MISIPGIVIVLGAIARGYMMEHGKLLVLLHARVSVSGVVRANGWPRGGQTTKGDRLSYM
jgi:hypothetical protein